MVAMNDLIEPTAEGHFCCTGRIADLVNIAGQTAIRWRVSTTCSPVFPAWSMALSTCRTKPAMSALRGLPPVWWRRAWMRPASLAALREYIDPVFLPAPPAVR